MDDAIRRAAVTLATRAARLRYLQRGRDETMVAIEKGLVSMARSKFQELLLSVPAERRQEDAREAVRLMRQIVASKTASLAEDKPDQAMV